MISKWTKSLTYLPISIKWPFCDYNCFFRRYERRVYLKKCSWSLSFIYVKKCIKITYSNAVNLEGAPNVSFFFILFIICPQSYQPYIFFVYCSHFDKQMDFISDKIRRKQYSIEQRLVALTVYTYSEIAWALALR